MVFDSICSKVSINASMSIAIAPSYWLPWLELPAKEGSAKSNAWTPVPESGGQLVVLKSAVKLGLFVSAKLPDNVLQLTAPAPNVGAVHANVKDGKDQSIEAVPAVAILGWPPKVVKGKPEPELPGICVFTVFELNAMFPSSST